MVASIDVSANFGRLDKLVASLSAKTPVVLGKAVLKGAKLLTGEIKTQLYDVTDGRGGLARSWRERFLGDFEGAISAEAYSDLIYARIQNDGGVIKAKGKLLAVPVRGAKIPPGKWPRHFPKTGPQALHLVPRPGRAPLLVQERGGKNSKRIVPMFTLQPRVTIRPHRYVEAAAARATPLIENLLREAFTSLVESS